MQNLKKTLDRFYDEFDFKARLDHDPIKFPHRYTNPEDIEVAGFIASCFAYGKVGLFSAVIEKVLTPGGKNPARFFKKFELEKDAHYFKGVQYRFNKEKDIICLLYMLSRALKEWGSLKKLFYSHYSPYDEDIKNALTGFTEYFLNIDTSPVYGKNIRPNGISQLITSPLKGSACKRMNLFLRWMVRDTDIDLGIWNHIPPSKLIIPLDTHIARISRCIGLTERNSSDWKTAKEITSTLKRFDPDDPLKYDFALCHHGISGLCKGVNNPDACRECAFARL